VVILGVLLLLQVIAVAVAVIEQLGAIEQGAGDTTCTVVVQVLLVWSMTVSVAVPELMSAGPMLRAVPYVPVIF
jgi:alpha-D-ribose 1-methylphosphonate 5-phosphate C-P lyase